MISDERKIWLNDLGEFISSKFFKLGEPVLPEVIARSYKITYCYGEYGDYFDGLLEHLNGNFHIYINTERHNYSQRHRFSFAHELGHFFIDEHVIALAQNLAAGHCSITGFISEQLVEREADLFAASLLMPETWVKKEYRLHRKFSFSILDTIAKKFQVSILSALYRVYYMDLHPIIIIKVVEGKIVGKPLKSSSAP